MLQNEKNTQDKQSSREYFVVFILAWILLAALIDL